MIEHNWLAERFEENRGYLRGVAYRLLGSAQEVEDAVQECWLRLSRSDVGGVENLRGWLTTVTARVCLDMLRSRKSRREEPLEEAGGEPVGRAAKPVDPETEALLADSVGFAMLVVLDRLNPAERIAFVLHDVFDVPFEKVASLVGRSPEAARQLASRARRRVRGARRVSTDEQARRRSVVETFLAALREGDAEKVAALLDPEFSVHADAVVAAQVGTGERIVGVEAWAKQAVKNARGARFAEPALLDGEPGLVVAPRGKLFRVLRFIFANDRIARMEVIGDPETLRNLQVAVPAR